MKRIYLYILAGVGILVFIILIALMVIVSKQKPNKNSAEPTASNSQAITLTIWRPIDSEDAFKRVISRYEEKHPNIHIKYVKKNLTDYETESLNAIASQNAPDIWSIPNSWLARHQNKLSPMPANLFTQKKKRKKNSSPDENARLIRDNFVPVVSQEVIFQNKVYGLPLFVDSLAVMINPRLFKQKLTELRRIQNVDTEKTLLKNGFIYWNDFVTLARLLTKTKDGQIQQAGAALGTSQNITNSADILATIMLQTGTKMNSIDKTQATFNLPSTKNDGSVVYPGENALTFYSRFAKPGDQLYSWDKNMPNDFDAFLNDRVAMIFIYQSQFQNLISKKPDLRYGLLGFPQIKGSRQPIDFARYWVETVPLNAKHQQAAWNFLAYLQNSGVNTYLAYTKRPSPYKAKQLNLNLKRRLNNNPWVYQPQTAQSWYRGPEPQRLEKIFRQMIQAVNEGESIRKALDQAASQATVLFRENHAQSE